MTNRERKSLDETISNYIEIAQYWFNIKFRDEAQFRVRLQEGLKFFGSTQHIEDKLSLSGNDLGYFSAELFQAMICGGETFSPLPIAVMWENLVESGIMLKSFAHMAGNLIVDHKIDQRALYSHLINNTFANIFRPPSHLPVRYSRAVASIDVTKNGDDARGTGFLTSYNEKLYFVTCKHNVDKNEHIQIKCISNETGVDIKLSEFFLSPHYDIAIATTESEVSGPFFALSDSVDVFDEVFTIGYPFVPRVEPVLVCHRGEVNGRTKLYVEKHAILLISNLVSPGSSGGPVLRRDGSCVGMTINWLEGQRITDSRRENFQIETMRFSAAIPSDLIRSTINDSGL